MTSTKKVEPIVYIVDDDDSVRRALGRLIRSASKRHQAYASGAEFLADVTPDAAGCLIVDIQMPGLTGIDVQRQLKSRGMKLPVIALSAQDDAQTREQARLLGAVSFFRKPVDDQALLDAIQWAIGG